MKPIDARHASAVSGGEGFPMPPGPLPPGLPMPVPLFPRWPFPLLPDPSANPTPWPHELEN